MSKTIICCPKCSSKNVRSYDNQPLYHPTDTDKEPIQFDNELYMSFICGDCKERFILVFDLILRKTPSKGITVSEFGNDYICRYFFDTDTSFEGIEISLNGELLGSAAISFPDEEDADEMNKFKEEVIQWIVDNKS
jgi:DNA-directed RNA polymerase subunit RPC12/RpoP